MSGEAPGPAADDRAVEALRAFGRYLHRERELRGLSCDDVARSTRLAAGVVESLEAGDAGRLPPRGYLFGYLRSYASAVGLDPDDVVLRFQEIEVPPGDEPSPAHAAAPRPRRGVSRTGWLLAAALALALLTAAAVGLWRSARGPGEIHGRRSPERAPYRAPTAP